MFASNTSQVSDAANYIEDVFSTWLYTGNGGTVTVNTGIDIPSKGGLIWVKTRSPDAFSHELFDSLRGSNYLSSNSTNAQINAGAYGVTPTSTGFTDANGWPNGELVASWTFRKQPKFFDVVTYTGNGANRTIAHNLGSVPGCIIVKRTDTTGDWQVYHRSLANTEYMVLNTTAAKATGTTRWNSTTPTSTVFSLGTDSTVNANGGTYVAYLFAHDAGGFGLTGTDNVISCGTFTTNSSYVADINLGYEPQYVMVKGTSGGDWYVVDNMRGMPWTSASSPFNGVSLKPNTTTAETALTLGPTSTGFFADLALNTTYIYIAIRRGPMKTPTSGTSVFSPNTSAAASGTAITTNFPVDLQILRQRGSVVSTKVVDRMRKITSTPTETNNQIIWINEATAESAGSGWTQYWRNTGFNVPSGLASQSSIYWSFARAPGFFDVVAYSGNGSSNRAINHNLGVAPELIIIKNRTDGAQNWVAYAAGIGNTVGIFPNLNSAAQASSTIWNNTSPTSSVFTVGSGAIVNTSPNNYIAYLFASCPGVSKVGSYTGTGATQTISCGFAARFVLIKRTDSTGDWFVWDTARGMIAGTDPRLAFNSTAAESNANWVYTNASGFQIVTTDATVNASGGSYIYLAIA